MKDCNDKISCVGRREFLVKAGLVAGGLLLTVSSFGSTAVAAAFEDVTVSVGDGSPLAKVGGFQLVDSSVGKIIVIHAADGKFVAFSAKCTHKGALVEYHADTKQISCPKHGSKFDPATGSVIKGPAEAPLPSYPASTSGQNVVVKVG